MYFPYLRGKTFELMAIRELVSKNLIGDKIVPIIEPVNLDKTLLKTLNILEKNSFKHAIVLNPSVGDFKATFKLCKAQGEHAAEEFSFHTHSNNLIKAYLMNGNIYDTLNKKKALNDFMIINQTQDYISEFGEVYDDFKPQYSLIPNNRKLNKKAEDSKVLFMDKFERANKNSDYEKIKDEFFSEDHLYFEEDGFKGFSDYSIVGEEYIKSGFAPYAVAIHIVYFDDEDILRVRHFVSKSNSDNKDTPGKFGEALEKLIKWVEEYNPTMTTGLNYFIEDYKAGKFPGLGTVKKYSIMHHLELMNKFLEEL